jgi:glycosyltransferase involved in cell wall biosynthesis
LRILSITAGAADMYCGSCLRDNALAAEMIARGYDVVLTPIYTPTITDEPNVSQPRIFFGGISVYLEQHLGLFRHTPRLLDRLWDAPAVLRLAARRSIRTNPQMLGEMTVSMLKGEDGHQRKEIEKLLDWLRTEPPFDVVSLPNSMLIALAGSIKRALNRPVLCTLQGEDLYLDGLAEPWRSESLSLIRRQLDAVDLFVAVSDYGADSMARYLGIPASRIRVVPLGINLKGFGPAPRTDAGSPRPFTIGYLARVAPEKGLRLLCQAYVILRTRRGVSGTRLEAAGYLAADHRPYLEAAVRELADAGLDGEFHYRGVLDRAQKIAFLQGLDLLSVPAPYREPKGLFLLEAMACGVPAVQPRHGAFPEVIAKTGGGILVEPDNAEALAEGLHALYRDRPRREALGRAAVEGVRRHYDVARMADAAIAVYEEAAGTPPAGDCPR